MKAQFRRVFDKYDKGINNINTLLEIVIVIVININIVCVCVCVCGRDICGHIYVCMYVCVVFAFCTCIKSN